MLSTYKTILSDKKIIAPAVFLFTFKLIEPTEVAFIAGQYMMLKVPKDGNFISRLYSIASPPSTKGSFELIIEIVPGGIGSSYVDSLKIGQEVVFQGAGGLFCLKNNEMTKIFLVTGTGIAPVRSMLKEYSTDNTMPPFYIFWGLKTFNDVYLLDEFKQSNLKVCLSKENNMDTIHEEDKRYYDLGHVDNVFEKQFSTLTAEQLNNFEFYLCGARAVVESLKLFLLSKSVDLNNIHFEKF